MLSPNALIITTDGSSRPKPRRGGIAVVFRFPDDRPVKAYDFPGHFGGTIDQMELLAVIKAAEICLEEGHHTGLGRIIVRTDSRYVAEGLKQAFWVWSRNKWCSKDGRPVDNADLWRKLLKLNDQLRVRFEVVWTPTKSDDEMKTADRLAKHSSHHATEPTLAHVVLRRPRTPGRARTGTLDLSGERVTVYIERAKYLRLQKTTKYVFQVLSDGPHAGKKGFVYSQHHMAGGHEYEVLFDDDRTFLSIRESPVAVVAEPVAA